MVKIESARVKQINYIFFRKMVLMSIPQVAILPQPIQSHNWNDEKKQSILFQYSVAFHQDFLRSIDVLEEMRGINNIKFPVCNRLHVLSITEKIRISSLVNI